MKEMNPSSHQRKIMVLTATALAYLFGQFKEFALSMVPAAKEEISAHHQQVIAAIDLFGRDYRKQMIKLTSALLQVDFEKIIGPDGQNSYKTGMVVVPIKNKNDHSYKLNQPCCVVGGKVALTMDGEHGNSLPDFRADEIRVATKEEIETFFSTITKPEIFKKERVNQFIKTMIENSEIEVVA